MPMMVRSRESFCSEKKGFPHQCIYSLRISLDQVELSHRSAEGEAKIVIISDWHLEDGRTERSRIQWTEWRSRSLSRSLLCPRDGGKLDTDLVGRQSATPTLPRDVGEVKSRRKKKGERRLPPCSMQRKELPAVKLSIHYQTAITSDRWM